MIEVSKSGKTKKVFIPDGWKVIVSMVVAILGATFTGAGAEFDSLTLLSFGISLCIAGILSSIVTAFHYYDN